MTLPESTSCRACGHQPWSSDRYCSACGSPLDGGSPDLADADVDPADHIVELEADAPSPAAGSPAASHAELPRASIGRWRQIGSALMIAIVVLVGWRVIAATTTGTEAASDALADTAAITGDETAAADDSTTPPSLGNPDPYAGKIRDSAAPAPAAEFAPPVEGFWPEPRHLREGLTPATTFLEDNPPERQAALAAIYDPVPITALDVGAGSIAVDISGGPVLIDLVAGDVSALAGRDQLLPVGAVALSEPGVVMRFADSVTFGGANAAAGVLLRWNGDPPIELQTLGWQTAANAGDYLLSYSGSPATAQYLFADLDGGRTYETGVAVDGPAVRLTTNGEIVFAAGADIVAGRFNFDAVSPDQPDVAYRTIAQGELLDAVGGFITVTCDPYPDCRLQLYDNGFELGASQRIDGSTLPLESVGPLLVAANGSGYATWTESEAGSFDLTVVGGTDDRALPDRAVVFANLLDGAVAPTTVQVEWAPNGNGLFLLDPRDRTLRYLSLLSGRVIELDLPPINAFLIIPG